MSTPLGAGPCARRDIKPENLLCSRRDGVDRVKLADFGSAMLLPPDGCAAVDPVAQGTTLYSPPEVLLGKTYSYAADMWATGITTCAPAARRSRRPSPNLIWRISPETGLPPCAPSLAPPLSSPRAARAGTC